MILRLNGFWLLLFGNLGAVLLVTQAEESGKPVTISHVYRIDSGCKQDLQAVSSHDQTSDGQVMMMGEEKDIVFKHKINFPSSSCNCADSEEFKALLYRVNGLEEEVTYLKSQCAQGCCKGSSGVDSSCSGHGVYQHNTCSCTCDKGWEGPDCSIPTCPDNCNNNGYCVNGQCVCHTGYTGHDCGLLTCPDDCNDKGHCIDGKCVCFEGFSGDTCSMQKCPNDCKENGRCIDGQCLCDEGFFGNDCSMDMSGVEGVRVLGQTEDSIQLEWLNPETKVDYFKLRHASPDGQEELENVGRSQEARTVHTLIGLNPGTEYNITVQAIKGSNEGKPSHTTGVTDIDSPNNLATRDITETTMTVMWDKVHAEVDGYILSYSSAEGSSQEIQVGADATSYQLESLKPGELYTIFLWAYKDSRMSRKSSAEAETEIDAPKNLKAIDVNSDSASLTWIPPQALIDGYILTYGPEDGSLQTNEKNIVAGDTRFILSNLDKGKKYIVTLIAYRGLKRSKVVEAIFTTVEAAYPFPMDCTQIMKNGNMESGVYTIYVANDGNRPIQVYCDMTTDGGGWIVFQRRNTGKLDFMKRWRQYVQGFGELSDEFWLGLENIHALTNTSTKYEARFDLGLHSERAYAVYDDFKVGSAKQRFKLTIGVYRGNAGDAMTYHQGRPFTTMDSDNDIALGNCAFTHHGAWWYKNCHLANLNGKFADNEHSMGMNWEPWKGHLMSLDYTEIKIRPVNTVSRKKRSLKRREAA